MKIKILSVLVMLSMFIGAVSAMSSMEYTINADNAVVSADVSYQNVLDNEVVLGMETVRLDYMNVESAGFLSADDEGIMINNTLKALPIVSRITSSGTLNQNFAGAIRNNETYELGISGFQASGRMIDLTSKVQVESTELSHTVQGQVAGEVGVGLVTETPSSRFRNVIRSRATLQNVLMRASWQTFQPAVEIEVPNSDISSLCVWATQPNYPLFSIQA